METITSYIERIDKNFRQKRHKVKYIKISLSIGFTVFFIWLVGFVVQTTLYIKSEGVFTTLNTLFSALAFAGVIVTIIMQRDELELQRDEMELQREEMEGQRKEFEKQNLTLSQQRFENTFFSLLGIMDSNRQRIGYSGFQVNFKAIQDSILQDQQVKAVNQLGGNGEKQQYLSAMANVYDNLYKGQIRATMNLYYKNFFNIQSYIDTSTLVTKTEKEFYMNIFYSQFVSSPENRTV